MSGLYQSQAEADDDEEVAPWHHGNLGIILWRGGGVGVKLQAGRSLLFDVLQSKSKGTP